MIIVFSINNLGMHILSSWNRYYSTILPYLDPLLLPGPPLYAAASSPNWCFNAWAPENPLVNPKSTPRLLLDKINLHYKYLIWELWNMWDIKPNNLDLLLSQLLINIFIILTYYAQVYLIYENLNLFKCIKTIQALIILVILEIIK